MNDEITLQRDVEAIAIPAGDKFTLEAGTSVGIAQRLGGNYTVFTPRGLVRIEGKDADALGMEVEASPQTPVANADGKVNEEAIWEQMKHCYDPEIPVNIVDLGLIYDCKVNPAETGQGHQVDVKMTLTAPGCGMGQVLADDVRQRVESVPGVTAANVEIVWEPQWNQGMMTEAARLQLGLM
ncbi:MAG: putative Fe-S cluster assembly protein SufT [Verrucomicrobiota bacterium]